MVALFGCQPEIGDSCSTASDCSVQDQRTCDTTYPGGYCTVFGCGADTCPEEATCIGFQSVTSVAPECASLSARPRLQRTACMRSCERNSDCRGGYVCVDLIQSNPWGALVVDRSSDGRVCVLPPPEAPSGAADVCAYSPAPEQEPLPDPSDAGMDAAPDGG